MPGRLLVVCKHLPHWGGDSTLGYVLCRRLQAIGCDAHYASLVDAAGYPALLERMGPRGANPDGLPNVHVVRLGALDEPDVGPVRRLVHRIQPDRVLAVNVTAAFQLVRAVPGLPCWFVPSSSYQLKAALYRGAIGSETEARAHVEAGGVLPAGHEREAAVVAAAERTICHSESTRYWFDHFYPEADGRIARTLLESTALLRWDLERHQAKRRPFEARAIDLLFVANRWDRPEKNRRLLERIVAATPDLGSHVVGECSAPRARARHHGFLSREAVLACMGSARVVVSPSVADAAPNVLVEACAMGANVVASPNCGNSALCHPDLLVDSCSPEGFVERARRAVQRAYPSRLDELARTDAAATVAGWLDDPGRLR